MSSSNYAAHADQRVGVFIDTQNLYHSAKSLHHANVNYEEMIFSAVAGRKLVRAFAYVIKTEDNTEAKFIESLEEIGIEIRIKDLQIFHTGVKKADWDVGISVDMIRMTEKLDVVVLASGDGDFIEVTRFCQSRGVRVEVMAFEKTSNAKLLEEADHFIDLSGENSRYLINSRKAYSRTATTTGYTPTAASRYGSSATSASRYGTSSSYGTKPSTRTYSSRKSPSASSGPVSSIFARPGATPTGSATPKRTAYRTSQTSYISAKPTQLPSSKYPAGDNLKRPPLLRTGSQQNFKTAENIFGYKTAKRKIKPVVGLPTIPPKPPKKYYRPNQNKTQTGGNFSLDNAFGNPPPKQP
jgi:uncharacterized LabA/DUF88 family protein